MPSLLSSPLFLTITEQLNAADIELVIVQKRVKNINFRLKPNVLAVSVPMAVSAAQVVAVIERRVDWALSHHAQVVAQHNQRFRECLPQEQVNSVILWGEQQDYNLMPDKTLQLYRQQLTHVIPSLMSKWQPIVGADANDVRIKKMHTRWGSCNTHARRIWLSTYLPAHPIECTEYVIVHELCHLHHPNHSRDFWQTVATAMPDYRHWHDKLAGRSRQVI